MADSVAIALYNRSLALLKSPDSDQNDVEALRLNAEAAKRGYSDAVLAMGWFHLNGVGTQKDVGLARKWYTKAARSGEPKAMFSLGEIAYDAEEWDAARRWFTAAAEKGHARSLFWIGKLCWRGNGVSQDRKRAMTLFQTATAAGVAEARRALRCLGSSRNHS